MRLCVTLLYHYFCVYCYIKLPVTIVVRCVIWYHLYNLQNVKNGHGGVLILVKLPNRATHNNFVRNLLIADVNPIHLGLRGEGRGACGGWGK